MVLQDFFWVSPAIDVTDSVIRQVKYSSDGAVKKIPPIRPAYLYLDNLNNLLKDYIKDESERTKAINSEIANLASLLDFNCVSKEAVWINPQINITNLVYSKIRGQAIDYNLIKRQLNIPVKLGFVNVDRILRESLSAKRAQSKLENEFAKREKDLQSMVLDLKKSVELFEKEAPSLSELQRSNRQKWIANQNAIFEKNKREFTEDLNARRNEELANVLKVANDAVRSAALAVGYSMVVQEAVFVDSKFDITSEVLKQPILQ